MGKEIEKNAIDKITEEIRKQLDDPGIIYTLHSEVESFEAMSSGIASIDEMMCGGVPTGRITEIFGAESSGKTTLMLHFAAQAQKNGDLVYYVDAENSLDIPYAKRIGVDPTKLLLSQPDYGEQALEVTRVICEKVKEYQQKTGERQKALIVVDSVPALVPKVMFDAYEKGGIEGSHTIAAAAQMYAKALPKIIKPLAQSKIALVFINQERDKIGVTWGSKVTQPGGRALKFFASVRVRVQRIGYYESGGQKIGIRTMITPVKSKLYSPFNRKAEVIITENGIDPVIALIDACLEKGVFKKSGVWIKYSDHSWKGRINLENDLRSDKKLFDTLWEEVKKISGD